MGKYASARSVIFVHLFPVMFLITILSIVCWTTWKTTKMRMVMNARGLIYKRMIELCQYRRERGIDETKHFRSEK